MIMDILKGLWKWIFWIFIIFILFLIVLAIRIFLIDRDFGKKDTNASSSSSVTDTVDGSRSRNGGSLGDKTINGLKGIGDAVVNGYKSDKDYEYNSIDFDDWFLMCQGERYHGVVRNLLNHLYENSKENFYAKTAVTAVGFGDNNTVSYTGNLEEYQNGILKMRDAVVDGEYEISFKYAGIMTYVNEIVITKK